MPRQQSTNSKMPRQQSTNPKIRAIVDITGKVTYVPSNGKINIRKNDAMNILYLPDKSQVLIIAEKSNTSIDYDIILNPLATAIVHDGTFHDSPPSTPTSWKNRAALKARNTYKQRLISKRVRDWFNETGCEDCGKRECNNQCASEDVDELLRGMLHGDALLIRVSRDGEELGLKSKHMENILSTPFVVRHKNS